MLKKQFCMKNCKYSGKPASIHAFERVGVCVVRFVFGDCRHGTDGFRTDENRVSSAKAFGH